MYIRWESAEAGREVSLWPDGRVKAMVNAINKVQPVPGFTCIVKKCPVVYLFAKRSAGLDTMPSWCRSLYTAAQAKLYNGPVVAVAGEECILCLRMRLKRCPGAEKLPMDSEVYRCACCLRLWHLECALASTSSSVLERHKGHNDVFRCAMCLNS